MILFIRILSFLVNIYIMIIFIRIILTWFSWTGNSSLQSTLAVITDPYLNLFRRFKFLRLGFLDLSPIFALGVLSLLSRILGAIMRYGRISIGIILALLLQAAWGAFSFILGFIIIILILRLIACFSNQSPNNFWNIIETISKPMLYQLDRILLKNRISNLKNKIIISLFSLGLIYLVFEIFVSLISGILVKLPV